MMEESEYFSVLELIECNNRVNYSLSMDEYISAMNNDKSFIRDTILAAIHNINNNCINYTKSKAHYNYSTIMFNHNGMVRINTSNSEYSAPSKMISFLENFLQVL